MNNPKEVIKEFETMREIKFRAWNKRRKRMSLVKQLEFGRNKDITIHTKNSGGHIDVVF